MKFIKAPDSAAAAADQARDFLATNPASGFFLVAALVAIFAAWASKELF